MPSLNRLKVVALLNTAAGAIERQGNRALGDVLASAFQRHGMSAVLEFLPGVELRSAAERTRQKVVEREIDAVIVGGGDGSIRTVASVLVGSDVPLGIIPLGTLNHFAKDLRIPLFVDGAVAVIASGEKRYVDVGELNGEFFINNSSIGIYPYLILERERRRRRRRLSKWTAMVLALPRVLRHLPLFRLKIGIQGLVEPCRSPCVLIGNNEYHLTVPAFGRRDRLDRGELCLYVAKVQSRLSMFWLACRCIFGLLDQQRDLRIFKGGMADISSRRSKLLVAFDGEVETIRSPLHCRTRPGRERCAYSLRFARTHDGPTCYRRGNRWRTIPRALYARSRLCSSRQAFP
jgi:diacylglycerol kinase family enzyme